MKTPRAWFAVLLLAATGCATSHSGKASADSETVLITYHPKAGKEAQLQQTLSQAWQLYRAENLVYAKPHFVFKDTEDKNKTRFVEIFTWIKSPEHPPANVLMVWNQEQSLCETRDGHRGIEGGEVEVVTGR
jgi:hypothetical protein